LVVETLQNNSKIVKIRISEPFTAVDSEPFSPEITIFVPKIKKDEPFCPYHAHLFINA